MDIMRYVIESLTFKIISYIAFFYLIYLGINFIYKGLKK